jgi:endonuclease I
MKKLFFFTVFIILSSIIYAQTPGYYNGTETKTGDDLKSILHDIIKGHIDFSYSDAKYILNYADEDPDNTSNLIQLYSNRSVSKDDWGTGDNYTNREHVWAKSHGDFVDIRPMDGDAHNLHPGDASVNITRSNYDFDEVPDGTYIEEADAYYNSVSESFEPSDLDKGIVARTIFYMAVRYEGTDNEMDLEVVDETGTYPNPTHGKLSTLLEWNRNFPPTTFEKRRNERVNQSQNNRNPFIDNPEFADLIWGNTQVSGTTISNLSMEPEHPMVTDNVTINATFTNSNQTPTATLYWGNTYDSETYSMAFTGTNTMEATIDLSTFADNDLVYSKIVTSDGVVRYNSFYIAPNRTITPISEVQGTGAATPISGQVVTISGIVTSNLDNSFYMQSGNNLYSGMCIYSIWRGHIGDSVAVTGSATEYAELTEMGDVTMVYSYGYKDTLEPVQINISDIGEAYEGMFIQLDDVIFSSPESNLASGTYKLTQGTDEVDVYVRYNSRLIGKYFPSGTLSVKAIVSQYSSSYQLLIDNIDWVSQIAITEPPLAYNDTVSTNVNTTVSILPLENDTFSSTVTLEISKNGDHGTTQIPFTNVNSINYTPDNNFEGVDTVEYKITYTADNSLYSIAKIIISVGSTSIIQKNNLEVSIFPSPSSGFITVNLNETQNFNGQINVFNLSGQNVFTKDVSFFGNQQKLDLNHLDKGMYLIQFDLNNDSIIKKVVFE